MIHARPSLLVPVFLVLLAPRAVLGDESVPWHHRPPIVLPEEGPPPWGAPGVVYLHIETRAPRLEMRVFDGIMSSAGRRGGDILSRRVCAAPCDRIVDAREGARYFFSGPGLVSSDYFRLNDRSGPMTARVEAGSRRMAASGALVGALGLLSAMAGGVLVGVGRSDPVDPRGMMVAGGVLLANGAVVLVTSAILVARQHPGPLFPARATLRPRRANAGMTRASAIHRPSPPGASEAPVFTATRQRRGGSRRRRRRRGRRPPRA